MLNRKTWKERTWINHTINSYIYKEVNKIQYKICCVLSHTIGSSCRFNKQHTHREWVWNENASISQFYWMNRAQTVYRLPMRYVYHVYLFDDEHSTVCSLCCIVDGGSGGVVLLLLLLLYVSLLIVDTRIDAATDVMDGDARNKCHGNADYCKDISGYYLSAYSGTHVFSHTHTYKCVKLFFW